MVVVGSDARKRTHTFVVIDEARKPRARLGEVLQDPSGIDARLARELLEDIDTLTVRANALEKEVTALVADRAPALLDLPGCELVTAANIVGETAGIERFASEAEYAMYAGVAPIPVWSGPLAGVVFDTLKNNPSTAAATELAAAA
jgi:transposase